MFVKAVLICALLLFAGLAVGGRGLSGPIAVQPTTPIGGEPSHANAAQQEVCRTPGCSLPPVLAPTYYMRSGSPKTNLNSTAANRFVMNWTGEGGIAENPLDPLNLVAAGIYYEPSAYNDTALYLMNGTIGVSTSMDGGKTWATQNLPASPLWSNAKSPDCGQIHFADPTVAFGPNNSVYVADLVNTVAGGGRVNCINPSGSVVSLYVTRSANGGRSWAAPVALAGTNSGAQLDKPWIATDQMNGYAYVAYDAGSIAFQASYDNGLNWTKPLNITPNGQMFGPEVVVDPWGGVDVMWIDEGNASIYFSRSIDNGSTFSTPRVIAQATMGPNFYSYSSSAPDGFKAMIAPGLAVDDYAGNPYTGRLFVVWQNGSGGSAGTPQIELTYSSNNGSSWSRQIQVNSGSDLEGFQPDAAVDPNGTVYVEWYGENATTGHYWLMGAISHNGATTFGTEYQVSDSYSNPQFPQPTGHAYWIGDYTDIIADAHGARPLWTAALSSLQWNCTSPCPWPGFVYNISLYTAEMTYVNLTASVPVTIEAGGTASSPTQLSSTPSYGNWLVGENYSLTAPLVVTNASGTTYFSLWYGSEVSTNRTVQGDVTGALELHACYVDTLGEPCQEPGAPGWLRVDVAPVLASVTVNGAPVGVNRTTGISEFLENDGNYTIQATDSGYYPSSLGVVVSPGHVSYANLTLRQIPGYLVGTVWPANANMTLTPAATVNVATNGTFKATLVPGAYTLTASLLGYTSAIIEVIIEIGQTTRANLPLQSLFGWVNGTIIPSTAQLTANGMAIPVSSDGLFSLHLAPGPLWLNGSAPGYLPVSLGPLVLDPLGHFAPRLWLPRATGQVLGSVSPENASVWVNGTSVPTVRGTFTLTLNPGNYAYTVSFPGYSPVSGTIDVVHNTTVQLPIVLVVAPGWLTSTIKPSSATVTVDGVRVALNASGAFNVSLAAKLHSLSVSAAGYRTLNETVQIPAGATLYLSVALTRVLSSTSTLNALDYADSAAVVAAIAIAAFVIWRKRRRIIVR